MKKHIMFFLFICAILFFGVFTAVADEINSNIETRITDDFDNPDTLNGKPRDFFWHVRGSKFIIEGSTECKLIQSYPDTLFTKKQAAGKDLHVLGVKGSWDRKGYNYLEVIPVKKNKDGKIEASPIALPGHVNQIGLWIWSSSYDYYVEIFLLDERGVNHRLFLGDMNYEGWRSLTTNVPTAIPQSRHNIIKNESLYLTKIVVWTRPNERVNDFACYFDNLRINTDTFIAKFDGDELSDPDEIDKIWSEGKEIQPK
jgi:hypothetical protein